MKLVLGWSLRCSVNVLAAHERARPNDFQICASGNPVIFFIPVVLLHPLFPVLQKSRNICFHPAVYPRFPRDSRRPHAVQILIDARRDFQGERTDRVYTTQVEPLKRVATPCPLSIDRQRGVILPKSAAGSWSRYPHNGRRQSGRAYFDCTAPSDSADSQKSRRRRPAQTIPVLGISCIEYVSLVPSVHQFLQRQRRCRAGAARRSLRATFRACRIKTRTMRYFTVYSCYLKPCDRRTEDGAVVAATVATASSHGTVRESRR